MTETSTPGKTQITLEGDRDLVVSRTFDAPRALVFKAWTEPDLVKQWWGPRAWPIAVCTIDLRVGGKWHYCMRGPEGEESWGIAEYQVIEPPRKIVVNDYFSDAEGTMKPPPMLMSVEFEELPGNRTRFLGRSTFTSRDHRDEVVAMGMADGITEAIEQLSELLDTETGRPA